MERENAIPEALQTWADQIKATKQSFVRATLEENAEIKIIQSSLGGGRVYWPADRPYPKRADGAPLYLLMQINFAEIPFFAPFPTQGLLQFFIADDPLYGMNEKDLQKQNTFRLIYHPESLQEEAQLLSDFSFLPEPEDFPLPWGKSYAMQFELAEGAAPPEHLRFSNELGSDFFNRFENEKWQVLAEYRRYVAARGHKLGGYAYFPQEDPRKDDERPLLLLQLDSDSDSELMWGDMGAAQLFINPEDLLALDFSRVMYYWSCY